MQTQRDPLVMKFAGGIVKHLGVQMYAGPVPALTELIANAWDANAGEVKITMPLDTPFEPGSEIIVEDDGDGMSYDDFSKKYLIVGRDRREEEGDSSGRKNRHIMAHKGIGKLAGFGIAGVVEVESSKGGRLTSFRMSYKDIEKLKKGEDYYPEPMQLDVPTNRPIGTIVRLRSLTIGHAINSEQFLKSIARRFSVMSDSFVVRINGQIISKQIGPFQFQFPDSSDLGADVKKMEDHWGVTDIANAGEIKWWIGFTKDTIKDEESRGISVIVRGKLAQAPWLFGLSGGLHGQHGVQYLTGEIVADFLDESHDLVATDRATILWYHPLASELQSWAQKKITDLLSVWADLRADRNIKRLTEKTDEKRATPLMETIEHFPPRERAEIKKAVRALASVETIDPERFEQSVLSLVQAYESTDLSSMMREITEASPEAAARIAEILQEFNVLEAVRVAQVVRGHIEVIRKFAQMIESNVKEKPDMQDHLTNYPWIIEPTWFGVSHEEQLETILKKHFGFVTTKKGRKDRPDFFCVGELGRAFVVEVKRPGDKVGRKELEQIERYVDFLRDEDMKITDQSKKRTYFGYLIASDYQPELSKMDTLMKAGIYTRTYHTLLETAERAHMELFEAVKTKAPADDPRIRALPPV